MLLSETVRNAKIRWNEHEDKNTKSEPAKHLIAFNFFQNTLICLLRLANYIDFCYISQGFDRQMLICDLYLPLIIWQSLHFGIFQGWQPCFLSCTNPLPFLIHFLKLLKVYLYFKRW